MQLSEIKRLPHRRPLPGFPPSPPPRCSVQTVPPPAVSPSTYPHPGSSAALRHPHPEARPM
ncbi:hypothetical protein HYPSUDRAFT_46494 [Hypholoma sublateritium FD-334 SS-4]|uniref:Uncharacterized protein n=1 Tax=Hypholoma sublateritium (strain FD-334 SS-4) TaxID=945553 RepID=A0A0D2NEC7_HYPSF|nr:hypothetical protein HYPSUDRAFT_46494 [Hypholoma sublateritium FD-334 SS-4]